MRKEILEGMSPTYREPYSYRQNQTETFDDMDRPSSALETRKGFDLLSTYEPARKGWPQMRTAPISEDMGGVANAANLSTNASIGNGTPENALPVRNIQGRRGSMGNEWDAAYAALSEALEDLESLKDLIRMRLSATPQRN